jgi:hypothetical protein
VPRSAYEEGGAGARAFIGAAAPVRAGVVRTSSITPWPSRVRIGSPLDGPTRIRGGRAAGGPGSGPNACTLADVGNKEQKVALDQRAAMLKTTEDVVDELLEAVVRAGGWAYHARAKAAADTGGLGELMVPELLDMQERFGPLHLVTLVASGWCGSHKCGKRLTDPAQSVRGARHCGSAGSGGCWNSTMAWFVRSPIPGRRRRRRPVWRGRSPGRPIPENERAACGARSPTTMQPEAYSAARAVVDRRQRPPLSSDRGSSIVRKGPGLPIASPAAK